MRYHKHAVQILQAEYFRQFGPNIQQHDSAFHLSGRVFPAYIYSASRYATAFLRCPPDARGLIQVMYSSTLQVSHLLEAAPAEI
jgi:hypothetical protein